MRIVLTGGVTGGHIYPAIAIGNKFKEKDPDAEIIYIAHGYSLEKKIIGDAGFELYEVESEPFYRHDLKHLPKTLLLNMKGRGKAIRIMKKFKPDIVVSTGSYVSVPVVLAAKKLGISVYMHEQNGYPGISNRLMSRFARRVYLGFETAARYFEDKSKLVTSGNPVRSEFAGRDKEADREKLGIDKQDLVIMVFGGSQGSNTTNVIGESIAKKYAGQKGVTIIWGTGSDYYDEITNKLSGEGISGDNVRIMPYISDMPSMLSACDISVSRSGALSVAETAAAGRVAIFVPSPNVTEDHQYYNAKALADAGGAFIVREDNGPNAASDEVLEKIELLANDSDLMQRMSDASKEAATLNATDIIYESIMSTYK